MIVAKMVLKQQQKTSVDQIMVGDKWRKYSKVKYENHHEIHQFVSSVYRNMSTQPT